MNSLPTKTDGPPSPASPAIVTSPAALGLRAWRSVLRGTSKKIVRDRVSLSAGSLAYHWFLALFPAMIAVLGFLSLVHVHPHDVKSLTHAINKALPVGVASVFTNAVNAASKRDSASATAIVVGIAIAIWSATGGMSALQQALDVAYEVPIDRKFLARRLHALPLMGATLLLGVSSACLIVFGAALGSGIEGHVPLHGVIFTVIWTIVRWAVTLILVSTLFSVFYFVGPNRQKAKWRWTTPGCTLATVVFVVASLAFSYYVTKFGSYGKTYGTFAGVAVLIFWLYLTGFAVLVGGEINAELERQVSSADNVDERKIPSEKDAVSSIQNESSPAESGPSAEAEELEPG
jgi:membrane protein